MAKTSKKVTDTTESTMKKAMEKEEVVIVEEAPQPSLQLKSVEPYSLFSDFDINLFKSGKHFRLFERFGSHIVYFQGIKGTYFSVWAPSAKSVSVIGNFNDWDKDTHNLFVRWDSSGIWEGFIPYIGKGEMYQFCIQTQQGRYLEKMDPYAQSFEIPPRTASIVWDNWYEWTDANWMAKRHKNNSLASPMSVYEVHIGSWKRKEYDQKLSFVELAEQLMKYVKEMGFTHVQFMPIMEHPYEPSWGYQVLGYFAPSSRFGTPQDFMYLVEEFHKNDIGVILDWVPSHFPGDSHGLFEFDGTHIFEHPDMKKGYHPDWKSYIFNYGRNEIRSFLISNAIYWLERYHADGLRVDAVASMLYLDYSRNEGEWEPNIFGGNHNLDAISLFKELNETVYAQFPDVQMIAEESTFYTGVSHPVFSGGLGFGQKWMMGWMNDTLKYFEQDPMFRKYSQDNLTFSSVYAFTENFMLPFSHDEVVYGKKSMVEKMPGDEWQRFANLRLLYTYMFTHPGTNLLFMGDEFGQTSEWNFQKSLAWDLLEYAPHKGMQGLVKALNNMYQAQPALYDKQFSQDGFEWIDATNRENSILVYARHGNREKDQLIIILNFTPVPRLNYLIGVPYKGVWTEILNSDDKAFYGSGKVNGSSINTQDISYHGKPYSLCLTIPPLAGIILRFNKVEG